MRTAACLLALVSLTALPAAAADEFVNTVYPALYWKAKHTVAKHGDRIAVAGIDVRIVASAGQMMQAAVPGGGARNPYCSAYTPQMPDLTEDAQSVRSHVTFGRFRAVHLGDLTWNKEFDLMCPSNPIGTVDLFVVSHHGRRQGRRPDPDRPSHHHTLARRSFRGDGGARRGDPDSPFRRPRRER